jgi:preprotein translocase SecE subunit
VAIVAKPQLRKSSAVAERRAAPAKPAPARRPVLRPRLPAAGQVGARTQGLTSWARQVWAELRKCTWPTREQTTKLTSVVVAISIVVGLVLGLADAAFAFVVRWFLQ